MNIVTESVVPAEAGERRSNRYLVFSVGAADTLTFKYDHDDIDIVLAQLHEVAKTTRERGFEVWDLDTMTVHVLSVEYVPEPTYRVMLKKVVVNKPAVSALLRDLLGYPHRETANFLETLPAIIAFGMEKADAVRVVGELTSAGAEATAEEERGRA
jgi:ribosomal protein L7/L12